MSSFLDILIHKTEPSSEVEALKQKITTKSVRKGTVLQRGGDATSKVYFVKKGLLRSYTIDEKGKDDVKTQKEVEKKIMKSIEELKFPKEGKLKRLKFASKGKKVKTPKAEVKTQKSEVKVKVKAQKAASKEGPAKKKAAKKEKKDNVAVITITDEGVYELDVEKLMEHSPIIVQKDGSYMVHLPSVFKGKKKGSVS